MRVLVRISLVILTLFFCSCLETEDNIELSEDEVKIKEELLLLYNSNDFSCYVENNYYSQNITLSEDFSRYLLKSIIDNIGNQTPRNRRRVTEYNIDIIFHNEDVKYIFFTRFDSNDTSSFMYIIDINHGFGFEDSTSLDFFRDIGLKKNYM